MINPIAAMMALKDQKVHEKAFYKLIGEDQDEKEQKEEHREVIN